MLKQENIIIDQIEKLHPKLKLLKDGNLLLYNTKDIFIYDPLNDFNILAQFNFDIEEIYIV